MKDDDISDTEMIAPADGDEQTDEKRLNFTYYKAKRVIFITQDTMSKRMKQEYPTDPKRVIRLNDVA